MKARVARGLLLQSMVDSIVAELEMKQRAAEVMEWLLADCEALRKQLAELSPQAGDATLQTSDPAGLAVRDQGGVA